MTHQTRGRNAMRMRKGWGWNTLLSDYRDAFGRVGKCRRHCRAFPEVTEVLVTATIFTSNDEVSTVTNHITEGAAQETAHHWCTGQWTLRWSGWLRVWRKGLDLDFLTFQMLRFQAVSEFGRMVLCLEGWRLDGLVVQCFVLVDLAFGAHAFIT